MSEPVNLFKQLAETQNSVNDLNAELTAHKSLLNVLLQVNLDTNKDLAIKTAHHQNLSAVYNQLNAKMQALTKEHEALKKENEELKPKVITPANVEPLETLETDAA